MNLNAETFHVWKAALNFRFFDSFRLKIYHENNLILVKMKNVQKFLLNLNEFIFMLITSHISLIDWFDQ